MTDEALGGSFRDPSGYVFQRDGVVYRRVNRRYAAHYDQLLGSGLYAELTGAGLLVAHAEVPEADEPGSEAYRTLRPEPIAFISYPYEWCFSQLRDAALTTLEIEERALRHDMTLVDASAYNVQFHQGRPLWIDTLSFQRYEEGRPWLAYRQFCQHFLAPLALMAYTDVRLSQLLRVYVDGVPLDLAHNLLPGRAWLNPHLLMHVRLHARYQRRYQDRPEVAARSRPVSRRSLTGLLAALRAAVRRLRWQPEVPGWSDYYAGDGYSETARNHKRELVARYLERIRPRAVLDLGANVGRYSRIASGRGIPTIACDADPACVEQSYRELRSGDEKNLLPLVLDLANPSPALGWAHRERASLVERRPADTLMALALVHHLAIANNVPLAQVSAYFATLGESLIVEFVPKEDAKVRHLLASREDIFDGYSREGFEAAFGQHWSIEESAAIDDSSRFLYCMRRRTGATPDGP